MPYISDQQLKVIVSKSTARLNGVKRWRHIATRGTYIVTGIALEEATSRPVVKYRSGTTKIPWTRPLDDFLLKFEPV